MNATETPLPEFRCTLCGECCRGDQKVWLNPVDLRRLARHLGFGDTGQLIDERIVLVEAGEHGAPRARLRFPPGPVGSACRFLVNDLDEDGRLWGKCSLHGTEAKPLVCRLAPLSRSVELGKSRHGAPEEDGPPGTDFEEWREVPPVVGCPGWEYPPPPEGRGISPPELPGSLRMDLNAETEYFAGLSKMLDTGRSPDSIVKSLYRFPVEVEPPT